MTTATRYATEKTEHGLLVRDVVFAVTGDTGRGFALTPADFTKFKGTFDRRTERGFVPAYVRLGHAGPRIGKIVRLADGNALRGDVLLEKQYDPDGKIAARIEADSISDLSVTFAHKAGALVDVSLLEDTFGQLHESLPPFRVDVKQDFEIEPSDLTALSLKDSQEAAMPTIEEIAALLDSKLKPVNERLTKLESGEPAATTKLSADPEVDNAVAQARKSDIAELAKLKRGLMVDGYLTQLSAVAGGATARQQKLWREKLVECANDEACTERFERLKLEIGQKTTKLDAETPFGKVSVQQQLKDEYAALGGETRLHMSEADYVAKWSNNELMTSDLR